MPKRDARWVMVRKLAAEEKAAIAASCERFITDCLRPRFLPEIIPTTYNYPVDILGRWRGSKYSFITRFRSGFAQSAGAEFDAAFARLDHREENIEKVRFYVMWHRHTGQWWHLHGPVTLEETLQLIATDGVLRPPT